MLLHLSCFGCHKMEPVMVVITAPWKPSMEANVEELLGDVLDAKGVVVLVLLDVQADDGSN